MTHLTTVILAILLNFSPHVSDAGEPKAERAARLQVLAEDIAFASRGDFNKMAFGIVKARFESGLARWVFDGCIGKPPRGVGDCDKGRSRGPWQNQYAGCPSGWKLPLGSREAQRAFAVCAVRQFMFNAARCRGQGKSDLHGAYSGYWRSCTGLPDVDQRVAEHNRVLGMLQRKLSASGVVLAKEQR